jgi:alanyl aminopeptidase
LRLSPKQSAFSGTTDIEIDVGQPTQVIWLHALGLEIARAELSAQGVARPVRPSRSGSFLALSAAETISPGSYTIRLAFTGQLPTRDGRGAYRQEENGNWYIFTQFEATDARRAFPCFDEPGFKIPWQITLEVPSDDLAFANTPEKSQSAAGDVKRVVFAETKPLPSYLVAFAVGPFEVVDAGTAGRKPTPVRIIVPQGKSAEAAYAAKTTGPLLGRMEAYFDAPYPYEKLDHIAVPQKGGAMENPGLITFGTSTILAKPDERNIRLERGYLSIAAHEIAHIWFGDLVTLAWWDDLWLNEAFATWMAGKIVDDWHPEWNGKVAAIQAQGRAMSSDALVSARRIRQPITSQHDIDNAFDGITYQKGAAVIAMFEAFAGPDRFRDGVRAYLKEHAHGNATAADFLEDVGAVVGDKGRFAAAFSSFLDQAGYPLVTATLTCAPGAPATLAVKQERYLPKGSPGAPDQLWQIPICVRTPEGRACSLLSEKSGTALLPNPQRCPAWLLANADGRGYYRVHHEGPLLGKLLAGGGRALSVPERLAVLGDVGAGIRTGRLPYAEALALVPALAQDENRAIVEAALSAVAALDDHHVTDELRPRYRQFVERVFGARARKLGWLPKPGEDDDTRLLRGSLVGTVAEIAEDAVLLAQARTLAEKWLGDRKAIPPELVANVLSAAGAGGDRALWDKFHAAAKAEKDRRDRNRLLAGMGSFHDPDIVDANLRIALSDEFDPRESLGLVYAAGRDRRTRERAYAFVKQNFDALVARRPPDFGAELAGVGSGFCDPQRRADLESFFKDRATRSRSGPRALAQILERIDLCIALEASQRDSVLAFLRKQ